MTPSWAAHNQSLPVKTFLFFLELAVVTLHSLEMSVFRPTSTAAAKRSYRNALLHHLLMCPGGPLRIVSLHARLQQGVECDSVWLEAC